MPHIRLNGPQAAIGTRREALAIFKRAVGEGLAAASMDALRPCHVQIATKRPPEKARRLRPRLGSGLLGNTPEAS